MNDETQVKNLLEEIDVVVGPVFIYPLGDLYNRFANSWIAGTILGTLKQIDSPEVLGIAKKIFQSDTNRSCILYVGDIFSKHNHFPEEFVDALGAELGKLLQSDSTDQYELHWPIRLLSNSGKISEYRDTLEYGFLNERLPNAARAVCLNAYLRIDTEVAFQVVIDAISSFSASTKVVVANVIITWNGNKVEILRKLLKESGGGAAAVIIQSEESKRSEEAAKKTREIEDVSVKFGNMVMVNEIISLRKEINEIALMRVDMGIELLDKTEAILSQAEIAANESDLQSKFIDLRGIISGVSSGVENLHISFEEAKKIIDGLTDKNSMKRPLNRLHIYLHSRNMNVPHGLWGVRGLNALLNVYAAHPDDVKEKIAALKKEMLSDLYIRQDWQEIHRGALSKYHAFLSHLKNCLVSQGES